MGKNSEKRMKRFIESWDCKYHTVLILESTIDSALLDCEFAKSISPGQLHAFRHALKIIKRTRANRWKKMPLIERSR